ncbi:MAG: peptidoglycan DD-metalloendopeptidase family protein [Alphaproteobacteria bacterium]|nr:peptidoglycan DD-metalloendopeptidase family protein [Alphaproteobacteria bacterium]
MSARFLRYGFLLLALGLGGEGAFAAEKAKIAPPDKQLKEIEKALEQGRQERELLTRKQEALAGDVSKLKTELVTAAKSAQEQEDTLTLLEAQLGRLRAKDAGMTAALERKRGYMGRVLMALERMAWRPTEALIALPAQPADTVRSAILLRAAVPQIEIEAADIRRELEHLAQVRADIARQRERRSQALVRLEDEQKRLDSLMQRKSEMVARTQEERQEAEKRVARLASEAEDLKDLINRIEEERRARALAAAKEREARAKAQQAAKKSGKPVEVAKSQQASPMLPHYGGPAKPFSQARGQIPLPARGEVVTHYGEPNSLGAPSKGIGIETRPGAQVVAPYDGQIIFAGNFRSYGRLLIIEHGEGYHSLIAGLGRIDGVVGQTVVSGEPLGVMGEGSGKPILYVELRRNSQPVNPSPWLAAMKDKVSG